jgi:hypothetical protein
MMFVFFIVFLIFTIQFIIDQETLLNIILSIIFFSFLSFIFVLSEILRFFYRKATKALIMYLDNDQAIRSIQLVKKFDILKGYRNSILVFYTLIYLDQGNYESLEDHIETPIFQTSSSLKLVYIYNKFYIAIQKNNMKEATELFHQISSAYSKKNKRRKAPKTVYSLNHIAADYYLFKGNLTKAEQNLKTVDENYLNPREKSYFYVSFAKFYRQKNNQQKEQFYLQKAKDISESIYHVKHYV